MARKKYRKPSWSLSRLRFRGPVVWSKDKRSNAGQCTKILSRCLVVIEMALAAVYSVVHAARRRQKGFDLAANFLGENGAGGKAKGRGWARRGLLVTRHSYYFPATSCARATLSAGTQMVLWLPKVRQTGRHHICLANTHMRRSPTILNRVWEIHIYRTRIWLLCIFIYKIKRTCKKNE